ncbi:hypothetical protein ACFY05_33005 [Microtetraspora fusca]|uniref:Uncharacterized protein n=1 Tax=Microtetraspora fusca TaxID=1997 RepID=A0ABW6VF82_MICFU
MTARRTRYQNRCRPIKVAEVFCPATDTWEQFARTHIRCTTCGRVLTRRVRHLPDANGAYGWVEHYDDGSTYDVAPGATPKAV